MTIREELDLVIRDSWWENQDYEPIVEAVLEWLGNLDGDAEPDLILWHLRNNATEIAALREELTKFQELAAQREVENEELRAEVDRLSLAVELGALARIEAQNPGIDMDQVKASRSYPHDGLCYCRDAGRCCRLPGHHHHVTPHRGCILR